MIDIKLSRPVPHNSRLTQGFAENPQYYAQFKQTDGTPMRGHNGLDWGVVKVPIWAAADGIVCWTGYDAAGYGRYVVIQHPQGRTIYAHLTSISVELGQEVKTGDVIGISGGGKEDDHRGNSTGPHLHFGYKPNDENVNNGYCGYVDPLPYLQNYVFHPIEGKKIILNTAANIRTAPGLGSLVKYVGLPGETMTMTGQAVDLEGYEWIEVEVYAKYYVAGSLVKIE